MFVQEAQATDVEFSGRLRANLECSKCETSQVATQPKTIPDVEVTQSCQTKYFKYTV